MDKNLRLSSSGKLLTRRLSCRTCQSLFCTNGTALWWLCIVSPAGPSLRWSRESLLVAAPDRLLLPVTISTPSELLPGPASQTAPQNPDPELRAPPTGPHCSLPFSLPCWKMPEKPEGPFPSGPGGEREISGRTISLSVARPESWLPRCLRPAEFSFRGSGFRSMPGPKVTLDY